MFIVRLKWIPWLMLIGGLIGIFAGVDGVWSYLFAIVGGVWLYFQYKKK